MLKTFKKLDKLHLFLALCFVFVVSVALAPDGVDRKESLFVGGENDTPVYSLSVGSKNVCIVGSLEVQGIFFPSGGIDGITRDIYLPMGSWMIDGATTLLGTDTVPRLITTDNIPCFVWRDSGETSNIQQTFRLPSDYSTGLVFYLLMSSDTNAGVLLGVAWRIWEQSEEVFATAPIEQAGVTATGNPHGGQSTSNEVFTLTVNATALARLLPGTWVTVEFQNETSHATANFEVKGTHGTYIATH